MFNLKKIVRPNIRSMKPYSSARDEFKGDSGTFLDANENPFGTLNRYPDPYQVKLKEKLAELQKVSSENVFIGNGSDEIIDLAFRIFCQPGKDQALTFSPTYGMYDVSAAINDVELIQIPLTNDFQINFEALKPYLNEQSLKLIFICSPNNPTGNVIDPTVIQSVLETFKGIVLIDEAYIDFSLSDSWVKTMNTYPNLIVSQTFSKARGLAAARIGVAYTNSEIVQLFNRVKPPYNVSTLNQKAALDALEDRAYFDINKQIILKQRELMNAELVTLSCVKKIHPSEANFLLIEVDNADELYVALVEKEIITRNRNTVVKNCLRLTIGTPEENRKLIESLKGFGN
ncbi:MAG: histidinol-phosphate transaminase [Crocinitomicaceae bacterium]|nr:histidinol-phosphate transaminase [Crocinitomicaceae bacterium]